MMIELVWIFGFLFLFGFIGFVFNIVVGAGAMVRW